VHRARASYASIGEGDSVRAVEEYRATISIEPNNSGFLGAFADFLANRGDAAGANELYMRAFDLEPTADLAWRVASSFLTLRRFKEAEQWSDIAISIDPANSMAHEIKFFVMHWRWARKLAKADV
jgi:Flp pilus assembly protein TadD